MAENSFLEKIEKFGKALENVGNPTRVSRRTALQGGIVAGLGLAGVGALAGCERTYEAIDLTQARPLDIEARKNPNPAWQRVKIIVPNNTIYGIAEQVYRGFNDNPQYYGSILRYANFQDTRKNANLIAGQELWIPNPEVPTFGFAAGEKLALGGEKIDGKDLPTIIEQMDPIKGTVIFSYNDRRSQEAIKVGTETSTSRPWKLVAVLKGYGNVPPRAVIEFLPKDTDLTQKH